MHACGMTRARRWIAISGAVAALLLVGLGLRVHGLLPGDEGLAGALAARFERLSGIGLKVGAVRWSLRPSPSLVLEELSTQQPQPITVRRVVLHPRLSLLWRRRLAIDLLEIEGAVLPRDSVRAFRGRWERADVSGMLAHGWTLADIPVERLRLRDAVWIDRREIALTYDASLRFDAHWRPREGEVERAGASPPARLRFEREGDEDRWRTRIDAGGGTWNGSTQLHEDDHGRLQLAGQLEAKDVDVGALLRTFGRRGAVEGRLQGRTEIDGEGENPTDLFRHLHTRTRFDVAPATLEGFDLARAVASAGVSHGGQTRLVALTGTLDTHFTDEGPVLRYSGLKARSGVLSASGSAVVTGRRIAGQVAVDIVDGVVGVPLKVGGTIDRPELSLTGASLAGAAVGTAVLPGVGTAIGARVGQQVDKLLGGSAVTPKKKEPR
jgi:hypothetical protein